MLPVVLLRHAGFPLDLLDRVVAEDAAADAESLQAAREALDAQGTALLELLRERVGGSDVARDVATRVGQRRPIRPRDLRRLAASDPPAAAAAAEWEQARGALDREASAFARRHEARLRDARREVVAAFDDPDLREVLLLSNDAGYPEFVERLDGRPPEASVDDRRLTDTLVMYLQRVAAKNETHAHFGPFASGRVAAEPGLRWSTAPQRERHVFFSHWAAQELADRMSADPRLRPWLRPRRVPLLFLRNGRVELYGFATEGWIAWEWRLTRLAGGIATAAEEWLLRSCDGSRTLGELAAAWADAGPGAAAGEPFEAVFARLEERGWLVARFEVPVGEPYPLKSLRRRLVEAGPVATDHLALLRRLERRLHAFADAAGDERPRALEELKATFERATGTSANRGHGKLYADRSIVFEECHSRLRDVTLGPDVVSVLTDELSLVYDLVLLKPRLRMRRELDLLGRRLAAGFGRDADVPLGDVYAWFCEQRGRIAAERADVDAELDGLDAVLASAVLHDARGDEHEIDVPRRRLEAIVDRYPSRPPALCNPDVMFAASDLEALNDGDFDVVVGDCHAVREILTHTSVAPLLGDRHPELLDAAAAAYETLLDDDELLVDVVRMHEDKLGSQLPYPCPDVEIVGRSPKPRDSVLLPDRLYVALRGGRAELRAEGLPWRLRLMANVAGHPSVADDPLSVFAFPRHFGGFAIGEALPHVPRIRCGRLVLQRERWRVRSHELVGANGARSGSDAADYEAATTLRRRLSLPRHVFAKVPAEMKPIYVDWDAPLLVRQLVRLARANGGEVELTEMFPGPDRLWLELDGQRFTSEVRCAVFSV